MMDVFRVEAPITNHLRDFGANHNKYKAVQNFPMQKDRNQEDYKFLIILSLKLKLLWIETKNWPEHITNV